LLPQPEGYWKGNDVELLLSYGIIRGMMKLAVIADGSGICGAPTSRVKR
jgi:hypothetical protein